MAQRKRSTSPASPAADPIDQITTAVIDRLRASGWTPPSNVTRAIAPEVDRPAPMQTIVLRVPAELIDALDARGSNRSDVARAILAKGLGLDVPEPRSPKDPRPVPRRRGR
jgi:hypothetical protein